MGAAGPCAAAAGGRQYRQYAALVGLEACALDRECAGSLRSGLCLAAACQQVTLTCKQAKLLKLPLALLLTLTPLLCAQACLTAVVDLQVSARAQWQP